MNKIMEFRSKTILITGGATGIGFGFAQKLVSQGNQVIITGRRMDKLKEAQAKLPSLLYFQCDVSDPDSIDRLFEELKNKKLTLDVVFNNAGVLEVWDVASQHVSSKDLFAKINANLTGPIAISQHFIRQAGIDRENYIINISSEAAIMPVPILPLYSASKTGLSVFTHALRVQLKNLNFKVIEVIPPATETKMTTSDMKNTTKLADPNVFAAQVIRQIESGKLYYAPSGNAKALVFLRRAMPGLGLQIVDSVSRKQLMGLK
jgi:uncharacterized oxidoreductase